jgi:hypothetical protein
VFGNNNDQQQDNGAIPDHSIDGVMGNNNQPGQQDNWGHPGTPLDHQADNNQTGEEQHTPDVVAPEHHEDPEHHDESATVDHHDQPANDEHHDQPAPEQHHDQPQPAGNDDLTQIKQQALSQLSPLVGHLDQSPEEKFRTTMMMLQATDDQGLVQVAFDSAQQIQDEKTRAQALLDVINEINYFTQPKQ